MRYWWIQIKCKIFVCQPPQSYQTAVYAMIIYAGPTPAHYVLENRKKNPKEETIILSYGEITEDQYEELKNKF